ncbi:MAG: RNA polymerase sigma factor [Pseudomonadota bacterium]|jgi:RNA polymerase sigma factor (sigma-70 family)|nr:MAG: RNA polymerase subunit sigma-70 [Pseudomonadota bacterium]
MSKRLQNGVESVYLACRGMLARAVRRIVDRHDVEDVLQEAFVRSFEAEGRQGIRDARAFLLRTARNVALDHVTSAGYRRTGSLDSLEEEQFIDEGAPVEAQVDSEKRFLAFCEAVGSLPEQCQRVFVLKKVYGLSQQEIASKLGIAESTVEKHIAKGLLLCSERMAQGARSASRRTAQLS